MSNCETFTLPSIEAEPNHVRDILRCLIHTILFNRALGHVRPKEVECEVLDLSYVCVDSRDVVAAVESGIQEFCTAVERRPPSMPVQVRLAFYERRQKSSWFGPSDERMYWETWYIPLLVISHEEALQRSMQTQSLGSGAHHSAVASPAPSAVTSATLQAMSTITQCCSERREHIPPVVSSSIITYPFDIVATNRDARAGFSLGSVKKMLLQTTPPPMIS